MTEAPLKLVRLAEVPYGQALTLQHRLRQELQAGVEGPGWLVALEHTPTVTLGKRGTLEHLVSRSALTERGIEVFRIDRGGEATYHGPGQLVIYPLVRLDELGLGVVDLVRGLARSIADTLAEYGVESSYDVGHPGVWTHDEVPRKIASVGMRVSRGVTTHGAAINLVNDMLPFTLIVPCGMPNAPMARLGDLAEDVSLDDFLERFMVHFGDFVERDLEESTVSMPAAHDWAQALDL